MVQRNDLSAWLDEYLSVSSVTDYQPNGLQVEGKEKIRRITGAVSVNLEVIEEAISEKADAVLVHHGMFWKSDDVTLTGYRKRRVARLLSHDINLFSYHLPLDLHPEVVAVGGYGGHWAKTLPIASQPGKGVAFNWLLRQSFEYLDTISFNQDLCVKVKLTKVAGP